MLFFSLKMAKKATQRQLRASHVTIACANEQRKRKINDIVNLSKKKRFLTRRRLSVSLFLQFFCTSIKNN